MQKIQHAIDATILKQVKTELDALAQQRQVTMISAIESGSRSWGFPSPDSDYDVRFIYAHEPEWYIQLKAKRDVIEGPVDAVLDIGGWDVQKAMRLANSGNMAIQEWLISPLVYEEKSPLAMMLREMIARTFSAKAACYHYHSMAKNMLPALDEPGIKLKKFFYISRATLSALWVVRKHSMPTTVFPNLLSALTDDMDVLNAFQQQIAYKATKAEAETGAIDPLCLAFVRQAYNEVVAIGTKKLPPRRSALSNDDFRQFLRLI